MSEIAIHGDSYNVRVKQKDKKTSEAEKVLNDYNAYVIAHLLKSMPQPEVDSLFGGGYAEATFRDFLIDEYAKEIALQKKSALNKQLSSKIANNLLLLQEENE